MLPSLKSCLNCLITSTKVAQNVAVWNKKIEMPSSVQIRTPNMKNCMTQDWVKENVYIKCSLMFVFQPYNSVLQEVHNEWNMSFFECMVKGHRYIISCSSLMMGVPKICTCVLKNKEFLEYVHNGDSKAKICDSLLETVCIFANA